MTLLLTGDGNAWLTLRPGRQRHHEQKGQVHRARDEQERGVLRDEEAEDGRGRPQGTSAGVLEEAEWAGEGDRGYCGYVA